MDYTGFQWIGQALLEYLTNPVGLIQICFVDFAEHGIDNRIGGAVC